MIFHVERKKFGSCESFFVRSGKTPQASAISSKSVFFFFFVTASVPLQAKYVW